MKFVNSPKVKYQPDGLPVARESKRPLLIRTLAIVALVLAVSFNIYVFSRADVPALVSPHNSTAEGIIVDGQNQPVSNALVFPADDASNSAVTDSNGRFHLDNLPTGVSQLVVVRNNVGQEFFITLTADTTTQLEPLQFAAPLVDKE